MRCCLTAQVSVNSQIHVIKTSHFHSVTGNIRAIIFFFQFTKKNTCGNPSTKGFLGFLNQALAFVTFFSDSRKIFLGFVVVSQKTFKTFKISWKDRNSLLQNCNNPYYSVYFKS